MDYKKVPVRNSGGLSVLSSALLIMASFGMLLLSLPETALAQTQEEQYRITLRSRTFIPEPGVERGIDDSLMIKLERGETFHIMLQFKELPTREIRENLEAQGVRLLSYINGNAYYAAVSKPKTSNSYLGRMRDTEVSIIRWAGQIQPSDRIEPDLLTGNFAEWAVNEDSTIKIRVLFFEDVDSTAQLELLNRYTHQFKQHSPNIWQINIEPAKIKSLASEEVVYWIEQEPPPYKLGNDVTRKEVNIDDVQSFNPSNSSYSGYSGAGIQVIVLDTGIDWDGVGNDHEDFQDRVLSTNTPYPGTCHGTHVAGILGGSGFRSNLTDAKSNPNEGTPYQWRGMAPNIEFVGDRMGWEGVKYNEAISAYGVDIANHSHSQQHLTPAYNSDAVAVDAVVRDNNFYVVACAMNNGGFPQYGSLEGYFSIIGSVAKNVISVGSYNSATKLRSAFSSMGPTFDGRIKPDLVAPGQNIKSTVYEVDNPNSPEYHNDGYGFMAGTSMASPCVAGVIALMLEAFWDSYGEDTPRPLPSTIKAILIETAQDLTQDPFMPNEPSCPDFIGSNAQPPFSHAGPDWATGYGLINAEQAVAMIQNESLYLQDSLEDVGEVEEFTINVESDTTELKVTLAWDDYPSNPTDTIDTLPKLVNDLNLRLIAPDRTTEHLPWVLKPLNPEDDGNIDPSDIVPAGPGEDRLNNVEQVLVKAPAKGTWIVRVDGVVRQPTQSYSLASNLPLSRP